MADSNVPPVPGAPAPTTEQSPTEGDIPEPDREQTLEEKQAEYAQEDIDAKTRSEITEKTGAMVSQALLNVKNAADLVRLDRKLREAIK